MFQSVHDLITAMQAGTGADAAVASVRAAYDHVSAQRVFYGNAMTELESQQTYLSQQKLQLSKQEDAVGGADLAEAATRLMNAQNSREATLSAVARMSQMNLFNYLK